MNEKISIAIKNSFESFSKWFDKNNNLKDQGIDRPGRFAKMKPPTGTAEAVTTAMTYKSRMVNPGYYGLAELGDLGKLPEKVDLRENFGKEDLSSPGIVWMPYTTICTHVSVWDGKGLRRTRQVSRWFLFKLWMNRNFKTKFKLP